jgi:hypothetical protein
MNGLTYGTGYWRNNNIALDTMCSFEAFPIEGLPVRREFPLHNVAKDTLMYSSL